MFSAEGDQWLVRLVVESAARSTSGEHRVRHQYQRHGGETTRPCADAPES